MDNVPVGATVVVRTGVQHHVSGFLRLKHPNRNNVVVLVFHSIQQLESYLQDILSLHKVGTPRDCAKATLSSME